MKAAIAMKKAHEIRREAAAEFGCKISEIHFGECLKRAWAMIKKYGVETLIKLYAIHENTRGLVYRVIQSAEDKIWEMEDISERFLAEIYRRYNAI